MNPPQWPVSYAIHDAALLLLLSEVMNQKHFWQHCTISAFTAQKAKVNEVAAKNEFVFQNPPVPLKASESLWKYHWREISCSGNSAAGWLGMLILEMYPVFIKQEPKDLIPWGQCLYLIQHETSVLLSLILGRDVETSLLRNLWIQRTNWTARWAVEWFRGGWAHWGMNCPT